MAKSYWLSGLMCPHCETKNRMLVSPQGDYKARTYVIKCWDAERQAGCLKEFEVIVKVGILTQKTEKQRAEDENRLVIPSSDTTLIHPPKGMNP